MNRAEGAPPVTPDAPSLPSSVAIIGLGLIGGSIARDLAGRTRLLLDDVNQESMEAALRELPGATPIHGARELAEAELVIIATPVDIARSTLERVVADLPPAALLTDVGSTKAPISRRAAELGVADRFVGSHPFTGDHRSGWAASRTGLFAEAPVYVSPTEAASAGAVERISSFWSALGGQVRRLEPQAHDELMAWTSHLPQIISSITASTLRSRGVPWNALGPGGRDVLRLAGSSPDVWTAITLQNASHIDEALEHLQLQLGRFRTAVAAADEAGLRDFFRDSRSWHGRLSEAPDDV